MKAKLIHIMGNSGDVDRVKLGDRVKVRGGKLGRLYFVRKIEDAEVPSVLLNMHYKVKDKNFMEVFTLSRSKWGGVSINSYVFTPIDCYLGSEEKFPEGSKGYSQLVGHLK